MVVLFSQGGMVCSGVRQSPAGPAWHTDHDGLWPTVRTLSRSVGFVASFFAAHLQPPQRPWWRMLAGHLFRMRLRRARAGLLRGVDSWPCCCIVVGYSKSTLCMHLV